jgi:hypothetical protein
VNRQLRHQRDQLERERDDMKELVASIVGRDNCHLGHEVVEGLAIRLRLRGIGRVEIIEGEIPRRERTGEGENDDDRHHE